MQSTDSVKIVIKVSGLFFKDRKKFTTYMDACMHVCTHTYTHRVKAILNRKQTVRGVPNHNLKLYCKTTVIKTAEFWHRNGN